MHQRFLPKMAQRMSITLQWYYSTLSLLCCRHAMAQDADIKKKLEYWVGRFILSNANKPLRG